MATYLNLTKRTFLCLFLCFFEMNLLEFDQLCCDCVFVAEADPTPEYSLLNRMLRPTNRCSSSVTKIAHERTWLRTWCCCSWHVTAVPAASMVWLSFGWIRPRILGCGQTGRLLTLFGILSCCPVIILSCCPVIILSFCPVNFLSCCEESS